jgi:hypothetical protein
MLKRLAILMLVLSVNYAALSCKVQQDTGKHKLFNKATVKRSNSKDTIAVIRQK